MSLFKKWILSLVCSVVFFLPLFLLFSCGGVNDAMSVRGGLLGNNITANAGSYGDVIFTDQPVSSPLAQLEPFDAITSYMSADETICIVDATTGTVTGIGEGECKITLTLSKSGYNNKIIEYKISVFLNPERFRMKYLFDGLFLRSLNSTPSFGDVDGDGDDDLVVGFADGNFAFYEKDKKGYREKKGSENPFNAVRVGTYSRPALANLDEDDELELISGERDGAIRYFDMDENGIYRAKGSTENPLNHIDVGNYSAPTFINFDDDDDLELVIGGDNGKVDYYDINQAGKYERKASTASPFNGIDVGDHSVPTLINLDNDDDFELVIGEEDGTLKYFDKDENGDYQEKTNAENPFNDIDVAGNSAPLFFDIDDDGEMELVLGRNNGTLNYFKRDENGNFRRETKGKNPTGGGIAVASYSKLALANLDEDDDIEFVVGANDGTLKYFDKNENGDYEEKTSQGSPFGSNDIGSYSAPVFANLDDDDELEFVLGGDGGKLEYFDRDNSGDYVKKTNTGNPFNNIDVGYHSVPTFANLDEDDDLELIVGEVDGALKYFDKGENGDYAETADAQNPVVDIGVSARSVPAFANFDDDDDLELIVGESDGVLKYFDKDENGDYAEKTDAENPFDGIDFGQYSAPMFADSDGDNILELFIGDSHGHITYCLKYFGNCVFLK